MLGNEGKEMMSRSSDTVLAPTNVVVIIDRVEIVKSVGDTSPPPDNEEQLIPLSPSTSAVGPGNNKFIPCSTATTTTNVNIPLQSVNLGSNLSNYVPVCTMESSPAVLPCTLVEAGIGPCTQADAVPPRIPRSTSCTYSKPPSDKSLPNIFPPFSNSFPPYPRPKVPPPPPSSILSDKNAIDEKDKVDISISNDIDTKTNLDLKLSTAREIQRPSRTSGESIYVEGELCADQTVDLK